MTDNAQINAARVKELEETVEELAAENISICRENQGLKNEKSVLHEICSKKEIMSIKERKMF